MATAGDTSTSIDQDLKRLLAGETLPEPEIDLHFLRPDERDDPKKMEREKQPLTKRSVGYIAMALIFNEDDKLCLIQEAKAGCRGKWYIPAGRMEPDENFIDGVMREVLEEAGLEFSPQTLLCIENYRAVDWFRICYVAKVTGGKLKTLDEADEESLQADWFSVEDILTHGVINLRKKDFFRIMKMAQEYLSTAEDSRYPAYQIGIHAHKWMKHRPVLIRTSSGYDDFVPVMKIARKYLARGAESRHPAYQVGIQPHKWLLHRPVFVRKRRGYTEVLCYKKNGYHFPCCQISLRDKGLMQSLFYIFRDVFSLPPEVTVNLHLELRGLLTVEHCGIPAREHDGVCFTSAIVVPDSAYEQLDTPTNPNYEWMEVKDPEVLAEFQNRVFKDGMLIPLTGG